MTLKQLFDAGTAALENANNPDAAFDARELLLFASDINATQFLLSSHTEASAALEKAYNELIRRRVSGEPLQYIIGRWSFLGNEFNVGEGVLIPRPETEELADMCIQRIKKGGVKTVYDLCAGTGCIGISIAKACPQVTVYMFEKYESAAGYCRENTALNGVKNAVTVICDITRGVPEGLPPAELIVSNPPYIPADELDGLQKEVHFEPSTALDGGKDGLVFYRVIASKWLANADSPAFCAVECGEEQSEDICRLFSEYGKTYSMTDAYGVRRFVCADI